MLAFQHCVAMLESLQIKCRLPACKTGSQYAGLPNAEAVRLLGCQTIIHTPCG